MSPTLDLTTRRPREVARAQRVLAAQASRDPFGHRKLVAELRAGNPYLVALMARRGLELRGGAIQRRSEP